MLGGERLDERQRGLRIVDLDHRRDRTGLRTAADARRHRVEERSCPPRPRSQAFRARARPGPAGRARAARDRRRRRRSAAGRWDRRTRRYRPARTPAAWPPARTGSRVRRSRRPAPPTRFRRRAPRSPGRHPSGRPSRRRRAGTRRGSPGSTSPSAPGGAHTATSRTPATRAGTTPITTVLGYGARPPGTYTPALATGARAQPDHMGAELDRGLLAVGAGGRDGLDVGDRALEPVAHVAGRARRRPRRAPRRRRSRRLGSAPPVSNGACSADNAASPSPRTRATISATAALTDSAAGTSARSWATTRGVVAAQADSLTPHRAAPAARRSPRPAACARPGWRSAARCSARSPP